MIELSKQAVDVGIVVADIDLALRFYCDEIGLPDEGTMAMPDGGTMHRLQCGQSMLKVISYERAPARGVHGAIGAASGFRYVTIWVRDAEEIVERCRAAGRTVVVEPWEFRPGIVVGIVEDPEGNQVELVGRR